MSGALTTVTVVVVGRRPVADGVVELELARPDGMSLPWWTPGAHIDLMLGDGEDSLTRQFSLCGDPSDRRRWRIIVLREPDGRGGSARVHETLHTGATVRARGPRNHFPFEVDGADVVFVAGGVGISPLLPMLAEAEQAGARWRLYYAGRSRRTMAYAAELPARYPGRVDLFPADEGRRLDVPALAASLPSETQVYTCGPPRLVDALEAACEGTTVVQVERFEAKQFGPPSWQDPFEVELSLSGVTVTVPPERSVLDVAQEAGALVVASCREGTCGTCEVPVVAGEVEHRDSVLSPDERRMGDFMMVCVSRAACPRLTLEL